MIIELMDETNQLDEETKQLLHNVLLHASDVENISSDAELSIVIVNNQAIQQLNNDYRQKNYATDVLSFPLIDDFHDLQEGVPMMLGDIIISSDKVKEQAEAYGHSFMRELAFLAVHGFLHLLGYTHDDESEEKEMFQKQEEILKEFQLERK